MDEGIEKKRILIVDDEKTAGYALEAILRRAGFETEYAMIGQEALDRARENSFDLVLLDIDLPGMSGLEVFRNLRKIKPGIKICLVTGWPKGVETYEKDYLALLDEGAIDRILRKPFTKEDILSAVREILKD